MADRTLSWAFGIDNVSAESMLPYNTVHDAVNVDINNVGSARRRKGGPLSLARVDMDSVWTSRSGRSYCASGTDLCRVRCDGTSVTTTALATLAVDAPVSFDDLNGEVVFANTGQVGVISAEDLVRPLGVDTPSAPSISNNPAGSMDAGQYLCAISYVADTGEESGLSPLVLANLVAGQGIRFDVIPQSAEARVTTVNLYRTEAGGEVPYLAKSVATGTTSYLLTSNDLISRQANNQNQERMPGGHLVKAMRSGFLLVANDNVLFVSQSLRYGRYDPRFDLLPFPKRITMLGPVTSGVFVGTDDGVFFLAGSKPADFTLRRTPGKPPIEGCSARIDGAELAADFASAEAIWLATNGFVLGTGDGQIVEPQAKRINLPTSQRLVSGSLFINNRRVTAALA